jgi:thiol-disulfide isomerase/thioredoxin
VERLTLLALLVALGAGCAADDPAETVVVRDLDGVERRPLDPPAGRLSVLLFVTTDCPIANAYAPEVARIVAEHARAPVDFHVVHVDPDLAPEKALAHARDYALPKPILIDRGHDLVRRTGATVTPEAVVLAPGGVVLYRGRIDDQYADLGQKRPHPTVRDLREALAAALAGKPIPAPRTRAVGCFIPSR